VDGSVYVALGREIDHGSRAPLTQQTIKQIAITNVTLREMVSATALQTGKIFQIPSVGQSVQDDECFITQCIPLQSKVAANEACPTRFNDTRINFHPLNDSERDPDRNSGCICKKFR
jgi:hypothetical protein